MGRKWPKPTVDKPSMEEMEEMVSMCVGITTDGCAVEPDGVCEHGHPSWLVRLGFL